MTNSSIDYVRTVSCMSVAGASLYKMLLDRGQQFSSLNWDASLDYQKRFACKAKQCYFNTQSIALRKRNIRYFEGFANGTIPVDHAWLVDGAGEVIDPTWVNRVRVPPDYFGIEIPRAQIWKQWRTGFSNQCLWEYLAAQEKRNGKPK